MTQKSPPEDIYSKIHFELRIPKARIAVLIGKEGQTKKDIETHTESTLQIDSQEGDILISGKDPIKTIVAKDICRAVGRGFNPDVALLLLKPDFAFELIDLTDDGASKNNLIRIKGRIIGSEGKSREIIEKMLGVFVSVFGKTVGLIGEIERVNAARQAIEMLITGSPHSSVYRWLEKKHTTLTKKELMGEAIEIKDKFKKYFE